MLVEFRVENFRSIRESATLSMIATRLDSSDEKLGRDNVIPVKKNLSLIRSAVIYGANASGKSNVLKAFAFMKEFVQRSANDSQADESIAAEPFLLRLDTRDQPSTFEAVFLLDGIQYRYGFSVTKKEVVAEWLYHTPTIREAELFTRDLESGIRVPTHSKFKEGHGLEKRTRPNALFLSVAAQFNGEIANRIRNWFVHEWCDLVLLSDSTLPVESLTEVCITEGYYPSTIKKLLKTFDLGITDLSVKEETLSPFLKELSNLTPIRSPKKKIYTRHVVRDNKNNPVAEEDFPLMGMESDGTQKIIGMLGPILASLSHGVMVFADEIDARLHPLMTAAIIRLFNSPETNPKNAQLICATHDTNLLDRRLLRRDQIYFTEKENDATRLYSLAEFKLPMRTGEGRTVRGDASYERDYIQGRYGAIPYLGDFRSLFREETEETKQAVS